MARSVLAATLLVQLVANGVSPSLASQPPPASFAERRAFVGEVTTLRVQLGLELVATGLDSPVAVVGLPSEEGNLLVVEQRGRVLRIEPARGRQRTFLNIRSKVGRVPRPWWSSGGEQGLLGLALDPEWPSDRELFVNYTTVEGQTVVERYRASRDLKRAKKGSARQVLTFSQPAPSHNGGDLHFGPDGMLYVAVGDGACCGDPGNVAQDVTSWFGKLLRIDVATLPYSIPTDNPSLPSVGRTEVWALGLRNPWRFSFDRLTGDLFLGDVGERSVEEIDYLPAGHTGPANFGWRIREGSQTYGSDTEPGTTPLIDPIYEYRRGRGSSVTGGVVYRGAEIPELAGIYFFADFVSNRVWSFQFVNGRARNLTEWTDQLQTMSGSALVVTCFGEDAGGELYLCDYLAGDVYKLVRSD